MSKYASLPDIDASGADVFETPDLPPQPSYSGDSDSEDEYLNRATSSPATLRRQQHAKHSTAHTEHDINRDRLDATEARNRFVRAQADQADKALAASDSKRTRRRLPPTDEYVHEDERYKESPLERLRRLRSEVAELEDQVRNNPNPHPSSPPPATRDAATERGGKGKKREISPAVILQQLQMLRGDLEGLEPNLERRVAHGTGEREGVREGEFAAKAKASLELLDTLGHGQDGQGSTTAMGRDVKGETNASARSTQDVGELEGRLSELEKLVGATEADIDESQPHPLPLLPTLSRLDHLLTLLTQPRHLDSISRRVKVLTSDLERIHESRRKLGDTRPLNVALQGGVMTLSTPGGGGGTGGGGGVHSLSSPALATSTLGSYPTTTSSSGSGGSASGGGGGVGNNVPPDALQKIDSLFSLVARIEPLVPLAPRLLTRLRSLQTLHESSTSFGHTLANLKRDVETVGDRTEGLDQVLKTLEESFRSNRERFEGNLKGLETRLEGLGKRLDELNR